METHVFFVWECCFLQDQPLVAVSTLISKGARRVLHKKYFIGCILVYGYCRCKHEHGGVQPVQQRLLVPMLPQAVKALQFSVLRPTIF